MQQRELHIKDHMAYFQQALADGVRKTFSLLVFHSVSVR